MGVSPVLDRSASPKAPVGKPFLRSLAAVHRQLATMDGGKVATYIPELGKADPSLLGIAIATLDGEVYAVGDSDAEFTIQSVSKPFAYGSVLDRLGRKEMLKYVGVEPTGDAFNSIVLDDTNRRPFNPMVNAGAIAVSALFPGETSERRSEAMVSALSRFAGERLRIDDAVFRSESDTGHRNRAIAYLLLNAGMLQVDPGAALDTYFRQCSVLVTTKILAMMAATLANGGVNPRTGERAVQAGTVPDILTVMLTCGMYDYAGQWAFEAGLPAKSGVAGSVIAVVPGQFGIAAFSPKLDQFGNSVRGVEACRLLSSVFSFHSYRQRIGGNSSRNREWNSRELRSRRWRPLAEREALDREGDRIVILEARGDLTIAATERVLRRAGTALNEGKIVLVDMKGVAGIDAGSARLLSDFGKELVASGQKVILAQPGERGVIARLVQEDGHLPTSFIVEGTLDSALETAETTLLASVPGTGPAPDVIPIESAELFRGFPSYQLNSLLEAVVPQQVGFAAGTLIVRQGDPTDAIYILGAGSVTVQVPASGTAPPVRITSLGPGAIFGEMGLVDGAPRSADIIADTDAVCWVLPIAKMRTYLDRAPVVMNRLLTNLVTELSDRLRQSNRMVASLR